MLKGGLRDQRDATPHQELDDIEERCGGKSRRSVARPRRPVVTSVSESLLDLVAADRRTRHDVRHRMGESRFA